MMHPARLPIVKPPRGVTLDRTHPLTRGLMGAWLLNELSGDAVWDSVGNAQLGTVQNGNPVWSNGGLTLTEASTFDWINLIGTGANPNAFAFGTDPYTVVAGIKTTSSESYNTFLAFDNYRPQLHTTPGGQFGFNHSGGGSGTTSISGLNDGTLHVCAIAREGTGANETSLYVDGALDSTHQHSGSIAVPIDLRLGWSGYGLEYFTGTVVFLYVFSRCLSAQEIAALSRHPYQICCASNRSKYFTSKAGGTTYIKDAAWQIGAAESKDMTWRLLAEAVKGTAWRSFNIELKSVSWRVLDADIANASWMIKATADESIAWYVLSIGQRDIAWAILNQSQTLKPISWRVLADASKLAAWQVLNDSTTPTVWQVLNEAGKNSAWQILTSGIFSQAISWGILSQSERDCTWWILNDTTSVSSWQLFNIRDELVGWHLLDQMATDSAWRVFNTDDKDVRWQILATEIPEPIATFVLRKSSIFAFNLSDKAVITFNHKLQ